MSWREALHVLFSPVVTMQAPPLPEPPKYHHPFDGSMRGYALLAARLNIRENDLLPFQHLSIAQKNDGNWIVFVMANDQPLFLSDEKDMFPSDKIINALRLLIK